MQPKGKQKEIADFSAEDASRVANVKYIGTGGMPRSETKSSVKNVYMCPSSAQSVQ